MSELPPDEPCTATVGTARPAEQARGGTSPVVEHRRGLDRATSAKALPTESQHAPPIEQQSLETSDAQEFFQIQRFVAAFRQQWPGAKIVLRPEQGGASAGANASPTTLQSHQKETS
jgi:hypothetical protein